MSKRKITQVNNLNFDAYDCILFLKDPSIRPDSLLNISKYLDRTAKMTNKSDVIDYIKFFKKHFLYISKEIETFKKDNKLLRIYEDLDERLSKVKYLAGEKTIRGKILHSIGKPICNVLGKFNRRLKWQQA